MLKVQNVKKCDVTVVGEGEGALLRKKKKREKVFAEKLILRRPFPQGGGKVSGG